MAGGKAFESAMIFRVAGPSRFFEGAEGLIFFLPTLSTDLTGSMRIHPLRESNGGNANGRQPAAQFGVGEHDYEPDHDLGVQLRSQRKHDQRRIQCAGVRWRKSDYFWSAGAGFGGAYFR